MYLGLDTSKTEKKINQKMINSSLAIKKLAKLSKTGILCSKLKLFKFPSSVKKRPHKINLNQVLPLLGYDEIQNIFLSLIINYLISYIY